MQRTQYCYSNTVCMSVLLSVRFRTATKATVVINIFAQLIAPLSYFLRTKLHSKILTGLPITRDKTASTALASSYLSPYCLPTSSHSSSRRHLRSAVSRQRFLPHTTTNYIDRSFAVSGLTVWNSVPAALRLDVFQKWLKTFLMT